MYAFITYLRSGDRRPNRVDRESTDERDTDNIMTVFIIYEMFTFCVLFLDEWCTILVVPFSLRRVSGVRRGSLDSRCVCCNCCRPESTYHIVHQMYVMYGVVLWREIFCVVIVLSDRLSYTNDLDTVTT